jgi:hypothetical protein
MMPLFNHEHYVHESISSALAQTFGDFELIICNDGSTDSSLEIAQSFSDRRVRIINKPNGGTVTALNACLLQSRGRYICWLSSDDLFSATKLVTHFSHHELHPESLFSVAPFGYLVGDERSVGHQAVPDPSKRLLHFLHGNYINGLSICARIDLFKLYGVFDNRYRYAHDVERWYRFLKYQKCSFLAGDAQSFTRMGSSTTPDADLLGLFDVIKFLAHDIQKFSVRCFVTGAAAGSTISRESLVLLCEHLFHQGNLFFRCGLGPFIVESVKSFSREPGLLTALKDVRAFYSSVADDEAAFVVRCLDEVIAWGEKADSAPLHSFFEHFLYLRDNIEDEQLRSIVTRYMTLCL